MEKQELFTCPMHPEVIKNAPGTCPKCGMKLVPVNVHHQPGLHGEHSAQHSTGRQETGHATHEAHSHHNPHSLHDKHAGHNTNDFLKRFWICLVLTFPVLALSHMIQQCVGFHISFEGDKYVLLLFGSLIYFYGGMPFLKGMVSELKANAMGMMTLVAIAISVAFLYSVAVVFGLQGMDFFWELATLIDIMLLGHWLEMLLKIR